MPNGDLLGGRVTARELVYVVGLVAGLLGSWYALTARVERVSERVDTEMSRLDQIDGRLAEHVGSPGHAVGTERVENLTRRVTQLEDRLEACHCQGRAQ